LVAAEIVQQDQVSIARACRIVQLDRSLFYYQSVKNDSEVEAKLTSYLENKVLCNRGCPEYYKRMRREGLTWNHKRVERVYKKMGLSKRRRRKRRLPNPEKRPLVQPALMNETWSMDFVEDRLENGRRIRTLNIIDDYNREALAMEVSFSFPAEQVIEVINQCIEWRGKPQKIRSDNGTEFIAGKTKEFFSNREILHIPIQKGKPSQNGYIERFNRSYREGVLDAFILSSLEQAREETMIWMQDYNHNHPHESLGDKSPVECL
jgi:putative transposase